MAIKNRFKKGEYILTALDFPAFVYETQTSNSYIRIYAFGLYDEHGSEYPEKAKRIDAKTFFDACEKYGHDVPYVEKMLEKFGIKGNQ